MQDLKKHKSFILIITLLLFSTLSFAQDSFIIKGKITDAETGEGVAFATVTLKGKSIGTQADFEGNYRIAAKYLSDSLVVSFVGYKPKTKALANVAEQEINFQLFNNLQLKAVIVRAKGENPALRILRKVEENKKKNDYAKLDAYECEAYNRITISVQNISEGFKKKPIIRDIYDKIAEIQALRDKDANVIIPIFTSETLSDIYFRKNPTRMKEKILKSYSKGLGVADDAFIAQLTSSGYNSINFYQNWVGIFRKEFMSPLANGGNGFYNYYLKDTMQVGLYTCYEVDFDPKNPHDLAFRGTAWIDTVSHALVQINANLDKTANINFIDNIKIQQEYEKLGKGDNVWMPERTRLIIDASELFDKTTGVVINLSSSLKDVLPDKPREVAFYDTPLEVSEDNKIADEAFWAKLRAEKMTKDEQLSFALIDTVSQVPSFKRISNVVDYFVNGGHISLTKYIDWGSTFFTYAYNNIEHSRFTLGLRTSPTFSKKFIAKAYMAYGTRDRVYKGGGELLYVASTAPNLRFGLKANFDMDQIGLRQDDIGDNQLFQVVSHFGRLTGAYYQRDYQFYAQKDFLQNFTGTLTLRHRRFMPLDYFDDTDIFNNAQFSILTDFTNPEASFDLKYIPNRLPSRNPNRIRVRAGTSAPIITLKYSRGLINDNTLQRLEPTLGNYHSFETSFSHVIRFGVLGKTNYAIQGFFTPSLLPINLLKVHLGNETFVYAKNAFNMMNYGEFASDKYVSFSFNHDFQGFFTNRVPLLNKLGWRNFAIGRVLWGSMRTENATLLSKYFTVEDKINLLVPQSMGKVPYIELGYGFDNIFHFLSIAAIHRLTHLDSPGAKSFGLRASIKITL